MVSVEPKQDLSLLVFVLFMVLYVHKICQEVHTHTHTPTLECFGRGASQKNRCGGTFKESLKFDSCECTTDFMTLLIHQRVIFSMNV